MSPHNIGSEAGDDPLVSLFLELTAIPSPSGREREVCDFLTMRLRGLGLEVEESEALEENTESAGNLYCRVPATAQGTPIMLSAHMDTVASEAGALPHPLLDDGVIRSGSRAVLGADDKAALAAIVRGVEVIIREGRPHAGIELMLTVGEESGLRGAKMADLGGVEAKCGFCFDSTGPVGGMVIRAPSQKTISATFVGRSAHAGVAPEEGRNALAAGARAIAEMRLGRIDDETTANIGIIRAGEAVNVIPDRCSILGEARSHDQRKLDEQVTAMLDAIAFGATAEGVDVESSVIDEFHSFDLSAGNEPYDMASAAISQIGLVPRPVTTGGGSDVNVFNLKGITCVNLSVGMEKVHTPDEYISVEALRQVEALVLALVDQARERQ